MKSSKRQKVTLSAIYNWITEHFMYYRMADPSWQVCSVSSVLIKVQGGIVCYARKHAIGIFYSSFNTLIFINTGPTIISRPKMSFPTLLLIKSKRKRIMPYHVIKTGF